MTPHDKRQYLQSKGYAFIYNLQENGMYKIDVWINDVFYKTGRREYKCKYDALNSAVNSFYREVINDINNKNK